MTDEEPKATATEGWRFQSWARPHSDGPLMDGKYCSRSKALREDLVSFAMPTAIAEKGNPRHALRGPIDFLSGEP